MEPTELWWDHWDGAGGLTGADNSPGTISQHTGQRHTAQLPSRHPQLCSSWPLPTPTALKFRKPALVLNSRAVLLILSSIKEMKAFLKIQFAFSPYTLQVNFIFHVARLELSNNHF